MVLYVNNVKIRFHYTKQYNVIITSKGLNWLEISKAKIHMIKKDKGVLKIRVIQYKSDRKLM